MHTLIYTYIYTHCCAKNVHLHGCCSAKRAFKRRKSNMDSKEENTQSWFSPIFPSNTQETYNRQEMREGRHAPCNNALLGSSKWQISQKRCTKSSDKEQMSGFVVMSPDPSNGISVTLCGRTTRPLDENWCDSSPSLRKQPPTDETKQKPPSPPPVEVPSGDPCTVGASSKSARKRCLRVGPFQGVLRATIGKKLQEWNQNMKRNTCTFRRLKLTHACQDTPKSIP